LLLVIKNDYFFKKKKNLKRLINFYFFISFENEKFIKN
jgi:hypothetical protein